MFFEENIENLWVFFHSIYWREKVNIGFILINLNGSDIFQHARMQQQLVGSVLHWISSSAIHSFVSSIGTNWYSSKPPGPISFNDDALETIETFPKSISSCS